jgi:hypothetical protein
MRVRSTLNKREEVENKNAHMNADKAYFPCYILEKDGKEYPALFTEEQVDTAIERGSKNLEDIPPRKYGNALYFIVTALAFAALWLITNR